MTELSLGLNLDMLYNGSNEISEGGDKVVSV